MVCLGFHFLKNDPSEIVQSMHKKLYRPESVIGEISAFGWYWLLLLGCLIISNFISPSPVALGNRRFFLPHQLHCRPKAPKDKNACRLCEQRPRWRPGRRQRGPSSLQRGVSRGRFDGHSSSLASLFLYSSISLFIPHTFRFQLSYIVHQIAA